MLADITSIKRHKLCGIHSRSILKLAKDIEIPPAPSTADCSSEKDKVSRAEIKLAAFFAEHNIALNSADHLKDIFPDSKIAQSMTLKRSKSTYVIKEIGKNAQQELADSLKKKISSPS